MSKWDWMVTGFNVRGERLTATKHSSQQSVYMEVQAWASRMAKPDDAACRVQVTNLNTGSALQFYDADEAKRWHPSKP